MFKLSDYWYGEEPEIFKKKNINIKPGLTVLVGCNGAGKTTLLSQMEDQLKKKGIPVLLHNNVHSGAKELKNKAGFRGNYELMAKLMSSSEGENITTVLGEFSNRMGEMSRANSGAKELWFLIDGIDSGLSIDNIIEVKEKLIKFVIKTESDKDIYFVLSANSYELARGEECFDVANGEYIRFTSYEDYRNFILKSFEEKCGRRIKAV
jgi:ATPase subunit of ABC transporter with duplicated ATPase domains